MYRTTAHHVRYPATERFDSYPSRQHHVETHVGVVVVDLYSRHTVAVSPAGSQITVPEIRLPALRAGTVLALQGGRGSLTVATTGWGLLPPARHLSISGGGDVWRIRRRRVRRAVIEDQREQVLLSLPAQRMAVDLNDNASDEEVTMVVGCWLSGLVGVTAPFWGLSF